MSVACWIISCRFLRGPGRVLDERKFSSVTVRSECMADSVYRFAWTEILKCLGLVLKSFDVSRCTDEPAVLREGFFNKVEECRCFIGARSWTA